MRRAALFACILIALDFTGVSYIDSRGVRALLRVNRLAAVRRRHLYIVGALDRIRRVLSLLQLEPHFALCAVEELPASCRWPISGGIEPPRPGWERNAR